MIKTVYLINGKARSGKDTLSSFIPNTKRFAFADKVKEVIAKTFSITLEELEEYKNKPKMHYLGLIFDYLDYVRLEVTDKRSYRRVLQNFSQAQKDLLGKHIWVRLLVKDILKSKSKSIVISDFRYVEELEYVKKKLSKTYKIVTVNIQKDNLEECNHSSEQPLDVDFDFTVFNNDTLEQLEEEAVKIFMHNTLTESDLLTYYFEDDLNMLEEFKVEYDEMWLYYIIEEGIFYKTRGYGNWIRDLNESMG